MQVSFLHHLSWSVSITTYVAAFKAHHVLVIQKAVLVPWNIERISEMWLFKILSSLASYSWSSSISLSCFLQVFAIISSNERIPWISCKKVLLLICRYFFTTMLKRKEQKEKVTKNFCIANFRDCLTSFSLIQNPCYKKW